MPGLDEARCERAEHAQGPGLARSGDFAAFPPSAASPNSRPLLLLLAPGSGVRISPLPPEPELDAAQLKAGEGRLAEGESPKEGERPGGRAMVLPR